MIGDHLVGGHVMQHRIGVAVARQPFIGRGPADRDVDQFARIAGPAEHENRAGRRALDDGEVEIAVEREGLEDRPVLL